jgi:uncharacterized damage-inducible protein DinB
MSIIPLLVKELENESITTRKMLERVPHDRFEWQPHPKSMSLKRLATHVAEIPGWIHLTLSTPGLDFASAPYEPEPIADNGELIGYFERSLESGLRSLHGAEEKDLVERWVLKNGDEVYSDTTKYEAIRGSLCQISHHRAQLGVYLRLLDIPIPGRYGPSADEMNF